MRIGLFGGTFDPIHKGHLQLAIKASEKCCLDKVVFIPTASPPHKDQGGITSFRHRVCMLRMALEGYPDFALSTVEEDLPAPNFTIDTLRFLQKENSGADEIFFLTGEDAFLEIDTWKEYRKVLARVHFIVINRLRLNEESFQQLVRNLGYVSKRNYWIDCDSEKKIIYMPTPVIDVSSTLIKANMKTNRSMKEFLPDIVIRYIREKKLYNV